MKKFIGSMVFSILLIFGAAVSVGAMTAKYVSLGVPTNVDTSFKTWMDWRCVTDKTSPQYKCLQRWAWRDEHGFMRANGESDLGVEDDYYMIALGSYYGTEIGTKYRITTETGQVFYGMLADQKADIHTNSTNQYARNNDVVEFLVDTRFLHKEVKKMGSAGIFEPLSGHVAKIERINFIDVPEPEEEPILSIDAFEFYKEGDINKWMRPLRIDKDASIMTVIWMTTYA